MSDKKKSWADIMDEEDELSIPVTVTKHGIKVKKPPPLKKKEPPKSNEARVRDVL